MDISPRIILDNGSGYLKCGLSNETIPRYTIPAIVGRPMLRYDQSIDDYKIKV
jgi:actin-related protein 2